MPLRFYKIALAVSLVVNVVLLTAVWAYIHFKGTLVTPARAQESIDRCLRYLKSAVFSDATLSEWGHLQ